MATTKASFLKLQKWPEHLRNTSKTTLQTWLQKEFLRLKCYTHTQRLKLSSQGRNHAIKDVISLQILEHFMQKDGSTFKEYKLQCQDELGVKDTNFFWIDEFIYFYITKGKLDVNG